MRSANNRSAQRWVLTVTAVGSTVPANGDVNPYGIATVPSTTGRLVSGDTLVSNFNSKANVQGTGTTIVQISPQGSLQLFAQISQLPAGQSCPGGGGPGLSVTFSGADGADRPDAFQLRTVYV